MRNDNPASTADESNPVHVSFAGREFRVWPGRPFADSSEGAVRDDRPLWQIECDGEIFGGDPVADDETIEDIRRMVERHWQRRRAPGT